YQDLMNRVFSEVSRVLTPTGMATVVFHASKPEIWAALGNAFERNGLGVEGTSIWDKTQVSFKQVVHDGSTRHDALFLLTPSKRPVSTGRAGDLGDATLLAPSAVSVESILAAA